MDATRRHLLRTTLCVAAATRVRAQAAAPSPAPAAPSSLVDCGRDEAFVDHAGWIIPREDRTALLAGAPPPPVAQAPPSRVEADEAGADSSGRR
ncbi:hypothetical protein [Luteitalea sp.]